MSKFENVPVVNNFEYNALMGRATVEVYPVTEVLPNGAVHVEAVLHDPGLYAFLKDGNLQALAIAMNASIIKETEDKSDPQYLPTFLGLVEEERNRQKAIGYTPEHDDKEGQNHLIGVAMSYVLNGEMVKAYAVLQALQEYRQRWSM